MSWGTIIYTWIYGYFVGLDEFKNKYYCNSKNFNNPSSKRWVIFSGEIEATKVPPHWHAWLHKTIDQPPIDYKHKYNWQKNHLINKTGTSEAYFPTNHPLSKKKSEKIQKDYDSWQP